MRIVIGTLVASAVVLASAGVASAAPADTLGAALKGMIENIWNPFFLLIAVGSAVGGIWAMARGLMKLAAASKGDVSGVHGFAPGLAWIVVGAMLIALPDAAGMGMQTLLGEARGGGALTGQGLDFDDSVSGNWYDALTGGSAAVGAVENCIVATDPAVCMARNIATNAVPMGVMVIFSLVFLAGLTSMAMTLWDMAKSAGGRDQSRGHLTRIVMAALLMNAPVAFGFMTNTLFGGGLDSPIDSVGLNTGSSLLSYDSGSTIDVVVRYSAFIGYAFTVLAFFGAWAYVRGIFMVKGVAEAGRSAGSYGMAGVYMVAGILMANAKASTCVVLNTVGGAGLSAGFCS